MDDNQVQNPIISKDETPISEMAIPERIPVQSTDPTPIDIAPVAPESFTNAPTPIPVEDQNGGVNEPKMAEPSPAVSVQSALAPLNSATPQTQSLVQQNEHGFIRSLLIKARAKIQFNKHKKLDKIIQFALTKEKITNDEVQKLLRISDKTAERYLKKLVSEGKLQKFGSTRDVYYGIPH